MIHVETLEKTRRGIHDFMELPYRLYQGDAHWAPPMYDMLTRQLLGENNPLMAGEHQLFVTYDDARPVARVLAGVDERLNARIGEKRGYISLFESENNMEYARAVLDAATAYLAKLGMTRVVGPNAPGFNDFSKGLLWEGFDGAPMLFNPYNPPYYNDFFAKYGFAKHRDHYAYLLELERFPEEEFRRLSAMAQKRFGFRVEHVDLRRDTLDALAENVARVIDESFPAEWELLPPTKQDILDEMESLLKFATSDLVVMAYAGERPIGLLLGFPDYYGQIRRTRGRTLPFGWLTMLLGRRKVRAARCSMMFVSPDYHNKAVPVAMSLAAYEKAKALGIREVEASTIDETNLPSLLTAERTGARKYRTYRQYELTLGE